jgi:S-adenosylmethionine-diacylglycerol 3-amino-3-carboxypropyl transferase
MTTQTIPSASESVAARAAFDHIRYSNCWEDSNLLIEALQPTTGKRILSIASAGDNSLHLLSQGAEVVAVDLNLTQLACLDLRLAAIRHLDNQTALAFLGFYPADNRSSLYNELKKSLMPASRQYWDASPQLIQVGIIHAGKFEAYFRLFRTNVLPLIHSRRTTQALLEPRTIEERQLFYQSTWSNWRWRALFRMFFSRFAMGRLGRDPAFFRYVEGSVADRILERAHYALTILDPAANPYLRYILTGSFEGAMPDWTRSEVLDGIRTHADRITLLHGGVEQATKAFPVYDGFNLSDIFEYMDEETTAALYGTLLQTARPGARLAYWNMLAPRTCPERYRNIVTPCTQLSKDLFARDRACFYSAFHVDEVDRV